MFRQVVEFPIEFFHLLFVSFRCFLHDAFFQLFLSHLFKLQLRFGFDDDLFRLRRGSFPRFRIGIAQSFVFVLFLIPEIEIQN